MSIAIFKMNVDQPFSIFFFHLFLKRIIGDIGTGCYGLDVLAIIQPTMLKALN